MERQLVLAALESRGWGQDHVGVTGGFVAVGIDADHELEVAEGGVESTRMGSGDHRVAGHGDERPDLTVAGSEDFVRQCRHGELAAHLGMAVDPTVAATGDETPPPARFAPRVVSGAREHQPTDPIEIAGAQREDIGGPRRKCSEFGGVGAESPVDRGRGSGGHLAGESDDGVRRHAGDRLHRLGCERCDGPPNGVEAPGDRNEAIGTHQVLGEEDLEHRHHEERIGAGPDVDPFVSLSSGGSASGIDDDDLSAA